MELEIDSIVFTGFSPGELYRMMRIHLELLIS